MSYSDDYVSVDLAITFVILDTLNIFLIGFWLSKCTFSLALCYTLTSFVLLCCISLLCLFMSSYQAIWKHIQWILILHVFDPTLTLSSTLAVCINTFDFCIPTNSTRNTLLPENHGVTMSWIYNGTPTSNPELTPASQKMDGGISSSSPLKTADAYKWLYVHISRKLVVTQINSHSEQASGSGVRVLRVMPKITVFKTYLIYSWTGLHYQTLLQSQSNYSICW